MALACGVLPAGPAAAATPQPSASQTTADCGLFCLPVLASSPDPGQTGRPRRSKDPAPPPAQPAPPAADQPAQPVQPAEPPAATAPAADAATPAADAGAADGPAPATPPVDAGYRPPTGPSSGQDWNTPVTKSAAPTQFAAVSAPRGGDPDGPALLPIAAGTVLLAAAAGAFAWWNRNRLRSH